MNEKETRLDEVKLLEKHINDNGINRDNPTSPIRSYAGKRRVEIEKLTRPTPDATEASIRLSEMDALEAYLQKTGIGNDNPEQEMRLYVKARRAVLTPPKAKSVAAVRGASESGKPVPPYSKGAPARMPARATAPRSGASFFGNKAKPAYSK